MVTALGRAAAILEFTFEVSTANWVRLGGLGGQAAAVTATPSGVLFVATTPSSRRPTGLPCWRDRAQRGDASVRGQGRNCRRQLLSSFEASSAVSVVQDWMAALLPDAAVRQSPLRCPGPPGCCG